MHKYTLLQEDSSSQSNEEEKEEKPTQDKQIKPKENDKDDAEVCMSVNVKTRQDVGQIRWPTVNE